MLGVQIDCPLQVFGDDLSEIHNSQQPSILENYSNSICYQAERDLVPIKESLTGHENNPAYCILEGVKQFQ